MVIQFKNDDPEREYHTCQSRREGDWIVFTCSQCNEYEQRINFKTQERISRPVDDPTIFHQGSFVPVGLESEQMHPN